MSMAIARSLAYIEDHSTRILVALLILPIVAFLITIPLSHADGMLIGSDGVYYYMYVRSLEAVFWCCGMRSF